jgi:hypothetical protein
MKIDFEIIEDYFDDTTHIRTMTEEALVPGKGWLIRTTIYTPHHITADLAFIPTAEASDRLFDGLA